MPRRVQQIIALIDEHLRRPLRLEALARSVNLSASRLRHLFKAETGMTPAKYQKLRRMHKALELAGGTSLSVKQVMERLGFSDASHFMRDFNRTHGITFMQHRTRCFSERERDGDSAEQVAAKSAIK